MSPSTVQSQVYSSIAVCASVCVLCFEQVRQVHCLSTVQYYPRYYLSVLNSRACHTPSHGSPPSLLSYNSCEAREIKQSAATLPTAVVIVCLRATESRL